MTTNWRYALFTLAIVPILILTAQSITATPFLITAVIASIVVAVVTFHRPESGLIIVVFSMLLSPQIIVANIPGRELTLRVDRKSVV